MAEVCECVAGGGPRGRVGGQGGALRPIFRASFLPSSHPRPPPPPSEGAHADFAPVGADQRALAALVAAETGETEVEAQCCGASLTRFHAFFAPAGAARLAPSDVSARALAGSCPACAKAVDTFLAVLGGEAANLGLKALSKGGVFIAGGIPLKLLPLITARGAAGPLQAAFSRPGCRFQAVRDSLPLCLVTLPDPGLSGALAVARQEAAALFRAPRDAPA